jgi:FkbM family methyltransferase
MTHKRINYFDLGLHKGEEIGMFLRQINKYDIPYNIYGFEAHPVFAESIKNQFKDDNINIYNYAISDKEDLVKLYLSTTHTLGNSIYASKNNVNTNNFYEVKSISFVDWVKHNVPDYKECINLLRFNIEGAELLLLNDIIDKDFTQHIDVFLGSHPAKDIRKCSEIANQADPFLQKLKDNGIEIYPYCFDIKNNINLQGIFDQLL